MVVFGVHEVLQRVRRSDRDHRRVGRVVPDCAERCLGVGVLTGVVDELRFRAEAVVGHDYFGADEDDGDADEGDPNKDAVELDTFAHRLEALALTDLKTDLPVCKSL